MGGYLTQKSFGVIFHYEPRSIFDEFHHLRNILLEGKDLGQSLGGVNEGEHVGHGQS